MLMLTFHVESLVLLIHTPARVCQSGSYVSSPWASSSWSVGGQNVAKMENCSQKRRALSHTCSSIWRVKVTHHWWTCLLCMQTALVTGRLGGMRWWMFSVIAQSTSYWWRSVLVGVSPFWSSFGWALKGMNHCLSLWSMSAYRRDVHIIPKGPCEYSSLFQSSNSLWQLTYYSWLVNLWVLDLFLI